MATAANLLAPLRFKSWLSTGSPNAFGTVATYVAGTVTPITTWTDSTAVTQNLNPVPLNARGEASIWVIPNLAYKFIEFDSLGNQINLTDQVVQSQLLTLYGGVDTGAVNAYILTFTANFSSLTNGIVIFWIPANTNTGASTLNPNSLGAIPIVNPNGSAISAGEITAGQPAQVMYYNGNFILLTGTIPGNITVTGNLVVNGTTHLTGATTAGTLTSTATTTGNLTVNGTTQLGFAGGNGITGYGPVIAGQIDMTPDGAPFTATYGDSGANSTTATASFSRNGKQAMVFLPAASFTSSGTNFTVAGLPASIQPARTFALFSSSAGSFFEDNNVSNIGNVIIGMTASSSTINFYKVTYLVNGWTSTQQKGIAQPFVFSYPLN